MHTVLTQNVQDKPGALHFTELKCTWLKHRTCKASQGHVASLVVSKKRLLPGTPSFSTERARLVVQVKRLRCTRLRHRTCKTSGSSKIAFLRRFPAYRGTSLRSWFQKKCLLPGWILFFFQKKVAATSWDLYFLPPIL